MEKQIIVVAAIIHHHNQLLIVQRSKDPEDLQPGLWEFPGGKVEHGEDPKNTLKREIDEELALTINNLQVYDVTSGTFGQIHAVMILYNCTSSTREIKLRVGNDYRWIKPNQLSEFKFAKLDIPVVERMLNSMK